MNIVWAENMTQGVVLKRRFVCIEMTFLEVVYPIIDLIIVKNCFMIRSAVSKTTYQAGYGQLIN